MPKQQEAQRANDFGSARRATDPALVNKLAASVAYIQKHTPSPGDEKEMRALKPSCNFLRFPAMWPSRTGFLSRKEHFFCWNRHFSAGKAHLSEGKDIFLQGNPFFCSLLFGVKNHEW